MTKGWFTSEFVTTAELSGPSKLFTLTVMVGFAFSCKVTRVLLLHSSKSAAGTEFAGNNDSTMSQLTNPIHTCKKIIQNKLLRPNNSIMVLHSLKVWGTVKDQPRDTVFFPDNHGVAPMSNNKNKTRHRRAEVAILIAACGI